MLLYYIYYISLGKGVFGMACGTFFNAWIRAKQCINRVESMHSLKK